MVNKESPRSFYIDWYKGRNEFKIGTFGYNMTALIIVIISKSDYKNWNIVALCLKSGIL